MTERIISADSHLELKPEKILGHLPRQHHEAYQDALMAQAKRILEGKPQKQLKNKAGAAPAPTVGLPTEKPWETAGRPGAYDPHERLKDMDIDQVDAEVLYANATGGAELYSLVADLVELIGPAALIPEGEDGAVEHGMIEWAHRFAQGTSIYGGTTDIQRNLIAEHVLGLPRHRAVLRR